MTNVEEVMQAVTVGPDEVLVLAIKGASEATLQTGREIAKASRRPQSSSRPRPS